MIALFDEDDAAVPRALAVNLFTYQGHVPDRCSTELLLKPVSRYSCMLLFPSASLLLCHRFMSCALVMHRVLDA